MTGRECTLALCGVPCGCQGRNPTHPSRPIARTLVEEARHAAQVRPSGPRFTMTSATG